MLLSIKHATWKNYEILPTTRPPLKKKDKYIYQQIRSTDFTEPNLQFTMRDFLIMYFKSIFYSFLLDRSGVINEQFN